ncbi:hypothetical protein Pla123a_11820 [Posidoniimonas polymericola]|uniref:Carboxypeptidase regulatory-like domain-containing protein n=1 Tax=Posidoniimonas polymericola TaxID=2528002 RepID=A0A5C5YU83_9BACT|nr:hypothetical protein [Posidoniimonas polymericola]TWT78391.1 hypothetical protein Pla123a_11820 [Posidoniimonas polymericola]
MASSARRLPPLVLLCAALVGCGGAGGRPETVPVSGKVLLDGSPLAVGQIVFQPISGGQPAVGHLSGDGTFTLGTYSSDDGAAVGLHRVRVTSYSTQTGQPSSEAGGDSLGELLVPERYANFSTSGLEVSVLAAGNAPFIIQLIDDEKTQSEDGEGSGSDPNSDPDATDSIDSPEAPGSDVLEPAAEE